MNVITQKHTSGGLVVGLPGLPRRSDRVNITMPMRVLFVITFGNGLFVAVGGDNGGSSELVTSPDGVTWTRVSVPSSNGLNGIAYGNNLFVAVGRNSPFLISSDGKSWTRVLWSADLQGPFYGVAFGNGTFVSVGAAGAVAASTDAQQWSEQNLDVLDFTGVAYGDAGFTLVGRNGAVWQSSEGASWSQESVGVSFSLFGIGTCGSTRISVGNGGSISVNAGAGWKNIGTTVFGGNEGVAAGNDAVVVVGFKVAPDLSTIGSILTSHGLILRLGATHRQFLSMPDG
jgi:hypothetical protein